MRNLTIRRAKSFVASLMSVKVYIEDAGAGETTINNLPCRKLGELKNGEEKTFEIGHEEARIFMIIDKVSKGYCSEMYKIPAGDEDVNLTGKNHFNPAAGNPFRFDNVTDPESLANRKRGNKRGVIVLLSAIIVGAILGVAAVLLLTGERSKTFSRSGMKITLTSDFKEVAERGFFSCYESKNAAVFVSKEKFSTLQGMEDLTTDEYMDYLILANSSKSPEKVTSGGKTYLEYTFLSTEDYKNYTYLTAVFKGSDSFWTIQFACLKTDYGKYKSKFIKWSDSVKVD